MTIGRHFWQEEYEVTLMCQPLYSRSTVYTPAPADSPLSPAYGRGDFFSKRLPEPADVRRPATVCGGGRATTRFKRRVTVEDAEGDLLWSVRIAFEN